ncbi:hypothetical protein [Streptomyces sp. NPDC059176]|uniref:hypothetical protein n=1 Tax=Streptomyces sp. NPDC059176 TaxID=3346758 RepID=UPI0036ADF9A0
MSRHWKVAVLAAAGFATITATTTLVAVTDDGKAQANASAVADQGKDGAQPAVVKKATTRGGGPEDSEDEDGDYWSERAGNPDSDDYSDGHEAGNGGGAADSGKRDGGKSDEGHSDGHGGKSDGGAADAQKRSGNSSGHGEQNGPGKGARDGGGDSGREGGRGGGGDGQGGHREGSGRGGEGWEGRDGHDNSGDGHGRARLVDCDPNDLISAITQANSDGGGTLTLAEKCTYTLTANQDGNGLPEIIQPITIDGNGATIARAANADQFRFFEVGVGGDLKLRHLTLTRGKAASGDDGGAIHVTPAGRLDLDCVTLHNNTVNNTNTDHAGAIYNQGVTTVRNSTLSGNSGNNGGAIYNYYGKLEVETSKFTNNKAYYGGGGIMNEYGTTTVRKSLFSYNYGDDYGGAVYQYQGLTDIEKSAFKYNNSAEYGGAIYQENDALHVRKSTFAYNTGYYGGALYLDDDEVVIEDSKIYGNTSLGDDGGGINNDDADTHIRRTVISGNQAPGNGYAGGGLYVDFSDEVTLTDVKITDNTSDEEAGGVQNDGTVTTYGKIKIIDNVPTNCEGSTNDVPNCFG